jgi:hypothetical protein
LTSVGQRPAFGTAFLLLAYVVLAPPLFLLAPLLLLLLASRPRTGREWLWIGLAALATARLMLLPEAIASLPNRIILASAATLSGIFLVLSILLRAASVPSRALLAILITAAAMIGWARSAGISIGDLDAAILPDVVAGVRLLLRGSPASEIDSATIVAGQMARVFSGMTALQAFAGLSLAWAWYNRVAARPFPPPSGPFRDFRFNDHLVWGAIVTLALAVIPVGATFTRAAQNGLVVWAGLYAARGLAIGATVASPWPLAGKLLLVAFAALTFPIATVTLITVGVADTWLDFRSRIRRADNGGGGRGFDAN